MYRIYPALCIGYVTWSTYLVLKTYKLLVFKRIFTLALSTKFITKLLYYQMFLLLRAFTHDKLSLATRKTLMDALKGLCVCVECEQTLFKVSRICSKFLERNLKNSIIKNICFSAFDRYLMSLSRHGFRRVAITVAIVIQPNLWLYGHWLWLISFLRCLVG